MKLYIKESDFIIEAIDDVKKYYPNISDDMFMQLIELDPTYRGNNSVGKYGKWLLNLYNKGRLSEDEFEEVPDLLNQFTTYRNRIQNKDLNSYKSLQDLSDILATVVDDDSMLTDRQKLRFLKNVKAGRVKISAEDDYDVVLDTPNFIVYVPNTHEASMKLGKGTEWCTAHENPEWYKNYTENGGKLYIVQNKKTKERWQYSDSERDFLNEYDDDFDVPQLMLQDEKLSKFFAKFLGVDYFNFDGTFIYNGQYIPDSFRPDITELIIPDDVTKIESYAFESCTALKLITIPDSVTFIGGYAFAGCTSLTSITIPDGVTKISEYAFCGCESLKSVNIPNGVKTVYTHTFSDCTSLTSITIPSSVTIIEKYAFGHCTSLTSITIPSSVTKIGYDVFDNCTNLTVYTNNNYIKEYCQEDNIPVKPLTNNESYRKSIKLHIKEN